MKSLLALSRVIDAMNERLSYIANWLVLLSCLISAGNAFSRYAFGASSNAWLDQRRQPSRPAANLCR